MACSRFARGADSVARCRMDLTVATVKKIGRYSNFKKDQRVKILWRSNINRQIISRGIYD
jgi:hypothetical protein